LATIHTPSTSEARLVSERSFSVIGLAINTNNKDEMSGSAGRLRHLWNNFLAETDHQLPGNPDRSTIYCVYTDYRGNENDEYKAVLGRSIDEELPEVPHSLSRVNIEGGEYLAFHALDRNPESVREAWSRVHQYFRDHTDRKRTFATDFDRYGPNGVDVYVGVQ
jgi:predicted transcriptional regulator YdeE